MSTNRRKQYFALKSDRGESQGHSGKIYAKTLDFLPYFHELRIKTRYIFPEMSSTRESKTWMSWRTCFQYEYTLAILHFKAQLSS